jgi:hypothetical protein
LMRHSIGEHAETTRGGVDLRDTWNPLQVCYLLVGGAIFVLAAWIELADHPVRRPIRYPNTVRT